MKLIPSSQIQQELCKRSFKRFIAATKTNYTFNWHHLVLIAYLENFEKGLIKNLMIFMPPQHGKSELVSRRFPAWLLGKNPNRKIIGASYSSDLSSIFNRDIQRIIDTTEYNNIFPETFLNESNVRSVASGTYLRNSDIFEIVNKNGSYKSVGVGGSLTGSPCDIGIIDDPVKDSLMAYSQRSRDVLWDWYVTVFKTRQHNNSQTLFTMTRWHEDDLAGRILAASKKTGEKWTILSLPAIKENDDNPEDERIIGQALWEQRHSLKKLLIAQKESSQTFTSLYQQRPAPEDGGIIKKSWLGHFDLSELELKAKNKDINLIWNYTVDGAYTSNPANDQTAILAYTIFENEMFIRDVMGVWLELPELVIALREFVLRNGYSSSSSIYIEPKASGLSIVQTLKRESTLNVIIDKAPSSDKVARARSCAPYIESRRVNILRNGAFVDDFVHQLTIFPRGKLKDKVDVLVMAIQRVNENRGGLLSVSFN